MKTDLLDGLLLGDGSLRCNGRMKNAIYQHKGAMNSYSGISTLPYLEGVRDSLETIYGVNFTNPSDSNSFISRGIHINNTRLKETSKTYGGYRIQSLSNEFLTQQHRRWYNDQIKRLPNDLVLTSVGTRHWYIGDGSLDLNRGYRGTLSYLCCVKLATQSFSYDEHLQLIDLFVDEGFSGDDFKINKRNNGRKYALYIYRGSIPQFFEYIGSCPSDCYLYKFQYEKYWNNPQHLPKKTISS